MLDEDPAVHAFIQEQYRESLRALYQLDCSWMNPWMAERALDQNKVLGTEIARLSGLKTIHTLYTDSTSRFLDFIEKSSIQDFAVKMPASWAATLDHGNGPAVGIYTNKISRDEARSYSHLVSRAPVIIQPYIAKKYELRVTLVCSDVWACRIDSQASDRTRDDWRRYDLENVKHSRKLLPQGIVDKLRQFMERAGLIYAAIDLIVTPENETYFVEVNPAGQYSWLEALTGMPISESIGKWLQGGH